MRSVRPHQSPDRFRRRLSAWCEGLRSGGADAATQGWLAGVTTLLTAAVEVVERDLERSLAASETSAADVSFAAAPPHFDPLALGLARRADRRVVWLERLFAHYRSGFEQRLRPDPPTPPSGSEAAASAAEVLDACDAVVRSCWLAADWGDDGMPPPPMPFLDVLPAPEAYPATLVPADLQTGVDDQFLAAVLPTLPVPLVRAPERSSTDAWMLGLLAHECGHHLQHVARLRASFRRQCADAASAAGGRQDAWEAWSDEVFADLVSVHLLGPAALWPIVLLELDEPQAMRRLRATYPPPTVRLALLAATAAHLGFDTETVFGGTVALDALPDHDERVAVDAVAATADHAGPDGRPLQAWLHTDIVRLAPAERASSWASWFRGEGLLPAPSAAPEEARLILAGLLLAHAATGGGESAASDAPLSTPATCMEQLSATCPTIRRTCDDFAEAALAAGQGLGEALAAWDPAGPVPVPPAPARAPT